MIKLFTHASDPDGLGCVILAKLMDEHLDFTLCKGVRELNTYLDFFLRTDQAKNYDHVYVTDLCPSDVLLQRIDQDEVLKAKFRIFDHHQTAIDTLSKDYSFVQATSKKDGIPCCGTSLFYGYLLAVDDHYLLNKPGVEHFVEMTRLHDTWEWRQVSNLEAFHLQTLFQWLGPYGYYYHFMRKLLRENSMEYTNEEARWIELQMAKNELLIEQLSRSIQVLPYGDYQVGCVFGPYEIRNDLAEYLKKARVDLDVLVLFAPDNKTVSFRALKENVEVRSLAESYGGGGHEQAASCSFDATLPYLFERVLK